MTDVFISYKREERDKARAIAETLARDGYELWWDVDLLPGASFVDEIAEVIKQSKVAIVLWSAASVSSDFVRGEADLARERNILIPVRLDDCDIPIQFRNYHTHDLSGWTGASDDPVLEPLVAAVRGRVAPTQAPPQSEETVEAVLHSPDDEAELWRAISSAAHPSADEYRHYLERFGGDARFDELARLRISALDKADSGKRQFTTKQIVAAATTVFTLIGLVLGVILKSQEVFQMLGLAGDGRPSEVLEQKPSAGDTASGSPSSGSATAETRYSSPQIAAGTFPDQYAPGVTFDDCSGEKDTDGNFVCPQMVVIRAGAFIMGSPSDEERRDRDEGPQHRVKFAEPFAAGQFEVTFAQWDACFEDGGCNGYRPEDNDWGRGNRPVINVSWNDAQAYVEWLSKKTRKAYRLLSEAEWEYVARARTTTPFHTGARITTAEANFDGNFTYNGSREGRYRRKTMPVDSFQANAFGVHVMHGNVWEWVQDCWHVDYTGAPDDGRAWETGGDCSSRVLRGGSWFNEPWYPRSAYRAWYTPTLRYNSIGFRVSRTLSR